MTAQIKVKRKENLQQSIPYFIECFYLTLTGSPHQHNTAQATDAKGIRVQPHPATDCACTILQAKSGFAQDSKKHIQGFSRSFRGM